MDLSQTVEPRSDQQNFDDYALAPKTVTVTEVRKGSPEQPVEIHLAEFPGRPFKPSKSMRRVLVACWGPDSAAYAGRKMTLFGDPEVRFGGQAVGGIRISHMSHISEPKTIALTVTRGKRAPFVVQPLQTPQKPAQRDWLAELKLAGDDASAVNALGHAAKEAGAPEDVLAVMRGVLRELQS